MDVLTVDFETYYDQEYSLAKMTMVEYIMDPRFQPIMMSYCINDGDIKNAIGYKQIKDVLSSINWGNTILNAQNCKFDATIIALRFGFFARFYTDTMAMARVTGAHVFEGASLDAIAKVLNANGYPVPPKGKAVATAKGKHLRGIYTNMPYLSENAEFDIDTIREAHELLMAYVEYCNNDVLLARQAFMYFGNLITPDEMQYGDVILKCYIQPSMYLDLGIIKAEIERIKQRDYEKAKDIADRFFNGDQAELRSVCRSAPKFTKFLKSLGGYLPYEEDNDGQKLFEIPYTYSEKKGINAPCFSRTHVPMIEMCERDDYIGDIFRCKLDLTSSIELSRAQRFEAIAKLNVGFGMPYEVSGAHTHRLGGCVVADTKVITWDGKSARGPFILKNIVDVKKSETVWNGKEFCKHDGVVYQGHRRVVTHDGITGTENHPCFVDEERHIELGTLAESEMPILDCKTPWDWDVTGSNDHKYNDGDVVPVYDLVNVRKGNRFWANGKLIHNSGGLNVQNLSSGRKDGQSNALKRSISVSDDKRIIVTDSSQIECVWAGSLVLTNNGIKKICDVSSSDLIFDGVEYVSHSGTVNKGVKDVIEYRGIIGTPNHIVYLADGRAVSLDYAAATKAEIQTAGGEWEKIWGLGSTGQTHTADDPRTTAMVSMQMRAGEISESRGFDQWFVHKMQKMRLHSERVLSNSTEESSSTVANKIQRSSRTSKGEQIHEQNVQKCREQIPVLRGFHTPHLEDVSNGRLLWFGTGQNRYQRALRERQCEIYDSRAERADTTLQQNDNSQRGDDVSSEICADVCSQLLHRCSDENDPRRYECGTNNCSQRESQSQSASLERESNDESGICTESREKGPDSRALDESHNAVRFTELGNPIVGTVEVYDIINCGNRYRFCCNGLIVSNCRVTSYIANDYSFLEVFRSGKDPYSVMASQIYGGDPDEIKRLAKSDVEPYSNIQRPTGKAAVLGCGFGTGPAAFRNFAKLMGVEMSEDDAVRVVGAFREAHQPIVQLWRKCDWVLGQMIAGGSGYFGGPNDNLFYYDGSRINHGKRMPSIRLPDGNWLHYYELCQMPREMPDGSTKLNYAYRGLKEGRIQWIYTYGGRITENLVQAFAFAVMKYQAMLINRRYKIVLNTHDEWGIVVPEHELETAKEYMMWCMRQVPEWAKGLPVDCEGDSAKHYGDCK